MLKFVQTIANTEGESVYEIQITGPKLNGQGIPYIDIDSPENSTLEFKVYDIKDNNVEKLSYSINKEDLEEYYDKVIKDKDDPSDDERHIDFHDICMKWMIDATISIGSIEYNDDIKNNTMPKEEK